MIDKAREEQLRKEFKSVVEGLSKESDRGCALFAAAYLDEALARLLKTRMVQHPDMKQDLFISQAPLGAFSARIKMVYYLGELGEDERKMLDIIRGIRNHFAHHFEVTSFSDQSIRDRCGNLIALTGHSNSADKRPRLHYIGGVAYLLGQIAARLVAAAGPDNEGNSSSRKTA
jgi:DNA-binding MltR family transcriptional regulator